MALSPPELKKLFAVSRNQCAFTACTVAVVDTEHGGIVVSEICHIRAQRPGGPRYDPTYPSALLDTAQNTLLLCPTHHSVIDKAPALFPVQRLLEMKSAHELNATAPDEELYETLERSLGERTSVVVNVASYGQSGGQTAAVIQNNFAPPTRSFRGDASALLAALAAMAPRKTIVHAENAAPDGHTLSEEIVKALRLAGWTDLVVGGGMTFPPPKGIMIIVAGEGGSAELALANVFAARGWRTQAIHNQRLHGDAGLEIRIGLP